MVDYAEYIERPAEETFARLAELVQRMRAQEQAVLEAEELVKMTKDALRVTAEVEIPELMDQMGLKEFKTTDGLEIEIDEIIRASIPKEKAPDAMAWLRANGHAALIKRQITTEFGKGEDQDASKLVAALRRMGLHFGDKASVHPSTLSSFVRQKLLAGQDVPFDLLGVFRQRVAKIKE